MEYDEALALQLRICGAKRQGGMPDVLLLLEHPPTITLGRNGDWKNLLVPAEALRARGVRCREIDRGGDITFHGPGQLVGYPLLGLEGGERDVHAYMRRLEESIIRLLARYGIQGGREGAFTGVWTSRGKIAAMGVHISRWITRHGFALNVNTDLSFYDLIVPCGIKGKGVTSISEFAGGATSVEGVARHYADEFSQVFEREIRWVAAAALEPELRRYDPQEPSS